jgi:hypothetical protein
MRSSLVKSLNLANVATTVAYQAMRTQLGGWRIKIVLEKQRPLEWTE